MQLMLPCTPDRLVFPLISVFLFVARTMSPACVPSTILLSLLLAISHLFHFRFSRSTSLSHNPHLRAPNLSLPYIYMYTSHFVLSALFRRIRLSSTNPHLFCLFPRSCKLLRRAEIFYRVLVPSHHSLSIPAV